MATTSIQKQEDQLKLLNQKIKTEKARIDQRLGKSIIRQANLDYAELDSKAIKELSKKVAELLKAKKE